MRTAWPVITVPRVIVARLVVFTALAYGGSVLAATSALACDQACPLAQPRFAYNDVDGDGCFDPSADSASIDAALLAGTYVAPSGGIVVPSSVRLEAGLGVDLDWSGDAVTVCGFVTSLGGDLSMSALVGDARSGPRARLMLLDGGALSMSAAGGIRHGAKARIEAGSVSLLSAGAVIIEDGARITTSGDVVVDAGAGDVTIGSSIRMDLGGGLSLEGDHVSFGGRGRVFGSGDLVLTSISEGRIGDTSIVEFDGGVDVDTSAGSFSTGRRVRLAGGTDLSIITSEDITIGSKSLVRAPGTMTLTSAGRIDVEFKARVKAQQGKRQDGDPGDLFFSTDEMTVGDNGRIRFRRNCDVNVGSLTMGTHGTLASDAVTFKLEDPGSTLRVRPTDSLVMGRTDVRAVVIEIGRTGDDEVAVNPFIYGGVTKGPQLFPEIATVTFTNLGDCDLSTSRYKFITVDTSGCTGTVLGDF